MKIGTILFTWHRSGHTQRVLDALKKNDILPEQLYIFQDGINEKTNVEEWHKVNQIINNIDFCETQIHVSENNKGCAKSIVSGINYVLKECDAVIVIEDDCVPDYQFMRFMVSALETYEDVEKVYSVSGYQWDVILSTRKTDDAYFNGRSCSYGWGTWRKKWAIYEENYNILNEIKKDSAAKERLRVWGNDLETMLTGNVQGDCDAWDVFWTLNIIKKGGYCLSSYRPLIRNIGFDGSGLHCGFNICMQGETENYNAGHVEKFCFPQEIMCTKECEEEFLFLFGGKSAREKTKFYRELLIRWIRMKQKGDVIVLPKEMTGDVAIWGKGELLNLLLEELNDKINAVCIIESRPRALEYEGIPIVTIDKLADNIKNIIVIPYFDIEIIGLRVKKMRPDIKLFGINEIIY